MAEEADDRQSYGYRLGEASTEVVRRPTRQGAEVEIPTWFDVRLTHPDLPTEVVLFVTVDADRGPILSGVRAGRGSKLSYAEALRALKETFAVTKTDMETMLQFVTALAAGSYATGKVLDPIRDQLPLDEATLDAIRQTRDQYAHRAFTASKPQRRVAVTRELLHEVAKVYRESHAAGEAPTMAVAEHFNVSHRTATRWVGRAREIGELGPAKGKQAGEGPMDGDDDAE